MSDPPPAASAPREPASSSRIPKGAVVADKYVVQASIGEGASGVVYRAVDKEREKDVALKVIHRHMLSDRQIRSRFYREASILRRLEGPNLVPMLGFGEHDDLLFMALELAGGSSLEALMVEQGPLDIDRSIGILAGVCDALASAHEQGIIHRDLKPANVMVEPTDDGERVRVLDFGMAKVMQGDGFGPTALTEQNMVFGTPEYMSPEQARGDELDARCDVYAAGVILYELLTGTVPFTGSTPMATMTAHLVESAVAPCARAPARRISPALEAVVLHAIAKEKRARYPTAQALKAALLLAARAPSDTESIRPPPVVEDDLAMRDTELSPDTAQAARPAAAPAGTRAFIVVAVVAASIGIALGVWLSLRG